MFLGLFAGEFAVLAADGEVVLVFGLGGLQIGLYAGDSGGEVGFLGDFTLPNRDDGPGEGVEALGVEFVTGNVGGDLLLPETGVGLWFHVLGAAAVGVPKAAVDEDDGAVLGQHEVGFAGKAFVVESVPVTPAPQLGPHNLLRSRVTGADAGHVP